MPIYEYRCPRGHLFERIHGFSDPGPDACDVCDTGPVEKVLYPVAVHFKGSGFYSTDYGRGARKRDGADAPAGGGDGGASSDGAGKAAGEKADGAGGTKPAEKTADS